MAAHFKIWRVLYFITPKSYDPLMTLYKVMDGNI